MTRWFISEAVGTGSGYARLYLGHVVGSGKVKPTEGKVSAIRSNKKNLATRKTFLKKPRNKKRCEVVSGNLQLLQEVYRGHVSYSKPINQPYQEEHG